MSNTITRSTGVGTLTLLSASLPDVYRTSALEDAIAALALIKAKSSMSTPYQRTVELLCRCCAVPAVNADCRKADVTEFLATQALADGREPSRAVLPAVNYNAALDLGLMFAQQGVRDSQAIDNLQMLHRILTYRMAIRGTPGSFRSNEEWHRPSRWIRPECAIRPPADVAPYVDDVFSSAFAARTLPAPVRACLVWGQVSALMPFDHGSSEIAQILMQVVLAVAGYPPIPAVWMFGDNREPFDLAIKSIRAGEGYEAWIDVALPHLASAAEELEATVSELQSVRTQLENRLVGIRKDATAREVIGLLLENPVLSVTAVAKRLNLSFQTVNAAMKTLIDFGIVQPSEGCTGRRTRLFTCASLMDIIFSYLHAG